MLWDTGLNVLGRTQVKAQLNEISECGRQYKGNVHQVASCWSSALKLDTQQTEGWCTDCGRLEF
jgi:hypothetical protein